MAAANDAAARTELGLGALATVVPGTGIATALAINVGSAGAPVLFNGALGTPSSGVATNLTGTAAGLTAGTASAVAVGGITGLGTGVGTFLATPSSANLAAAVTGETGSGALVFGTSPAFTTNFTLANGASPTTSAVAQMAFDTDAWAASRGAVAVHDGTATTWLVGVLASDTPSNGQVPTWNTGGTITWETPGGAANAVTAASAAAGAGLLWVSGGADRTATATDTVATLNATTGNVTTLNLAENGGIVLDAALSADGTYCGIVEAGTAGATLAFGDVCYLAAADSRWELTDADAEATSGPVKIGICVLAAAADGDPTTMLLFGKIRADAAFPTFTVSAPVYLSGTAGDVTNTAPTATDSVTRIVGYGNDGNTLFWCPDPTWITHT